MNNPTEFKECFDFITYKFPNIKCDSTNLKEMSLILEKLINARINYLVENFIHKDDWPDDLELSDLEDYHNMICREFYLSNKKY